MRRLLAALIAIVSLSALAHAQPAITFFESDIRVNRDGSALVLESYEFAAAPGSFTRRIATDSPAMFSNRMYLIDVATADDEHGRDVKYRVMRYTGHIRIELPSFTGTRLQLAYRVRNAIHFGANDELLWIANETSVPAETAVFKVTLPEAAAGQIRAQAFLRDAGVKSRTMLWSFNGQMVTAIDGTQVEAVAPGPLSAGVAAVVHVSLPDGIIEQPGALTRTGWFIRANPAVVLPFIAFAFMFTAWRVKRRKADPGVSIAPMYEPPEGLSPAEIGTLVDDCVDPRDVTATLIDLAVRGYVKLEKLPRHEGEREDYVVRLVKPRELWFELKPHERTMLFHTFYGGQWTQLSSLRLRFPDIVPYMRSNIFASLKRAGMYRVLPEHVVALHQIVFAFAYVAVWILLKVPWSWVGTVIGQIRLASVATILSLLASVAIVFLLGRKSSPKTLRGMRTYAYIRGFEEFLRAVEGDRMKRIEPGLYEKYLPYAMALGIEHRWTKAFEGIAIHQLNWYDVEGELGDTAAFGHHLSEILATSAMAAPRGRFPMPIAEAFGRVATSASSGR